MAKLGRSRQLDVAATDSEALETLRQWWRENGKFAGAGMVLALAGVGGWKGLEHYRDTRAGEAAEYYVEFIDRLDVLEADEDADPDAALPELPPDEYVDTPYLAFAYMRRAQYFVEHDNLEAAMNDLQWVTDNAVQQVLSELAHVRIVRILIAMDKTAEALAHLDEVVFSTGITPLAEEARGDALIKNNDREGALVAYRAAWQLLSSKPDFLRMKLESLGHSVEPPQSSGPLSGRPPGQ